MGKIVETVLDIILLILCAVSLLNIVGANNNAISANDYASNVQAIISASNLNSEVITNCEEDARNKGYDLNVTIYNGASALSKYAGLDLNYDYKIALFGFETTHTKTKIAR